MPDDDAGASSVDDIVAHRILVPGENDEAGRVGANLRVLHQWEDNRGAATDARALADEPRGRCLTIVRELGNTVVDLAEERLRSKHVVPSLLD